MGRREKQREGVRKGGKKGEGRERERRTKKNTCGRSGVSKLSPPAMLKYFQLCTSVSSAQLRHLAS